MRPYTTVAHHGKSIVVVDIADASPEQIIQALAEAQKNIAKLAPKSGLILTEVTNAVYNPASSNAVKEFTSKNTPFVEASAVVGAAGLQQVLLQTVAMISGREIKAFKSRPEALDWLASHN